MPHFNTLESWLLDFQQLGLTQEVLSDAATQIENVDFAKWFAACDEYTKYMKKFYLPFLATGWQLILLHPITSAFYKVLNDPTTRDYQLEIVTILMLAHPHVATVLFNEQNNALKLTGKQGRNLLHYAAIFGNSDLVTNIMELAPGLIYEADKKGKHVLHFSVEKGDEISIEAILKKAPALLTLNNQSESHVLLYAARSGVIAVFNAIYRLCPSLLKVECNLGSNCAHWAARSGNIELLKMILDLAPELFDKRTNSGDTILHNAVQSNCAMIDFILLKKRSLIFMRNYVGYSVADIAAMEGLTENVFKLLEYDQSLLQEPSNKNTLLHNAALSGNPKLIARLLPLTTHFLMSNFQGNIPLQLAANSGNATALNLLLQATACDNTRLVDTIIRVIKSGSLPCLSLLTTQLQNLSPHQHKLLFRGALLSEQKIMINYIIKLYGINHEDAYDSLNFAMQAHFYLGVEIALELVPSLLAVTKEGYNLMFVATRAGCLPMMRLLFLKAPQLIFGETIITTTALHCAASSGKLEALQFVVQNAPRLSFTSIAASGTVLQAALLSRNIAVIEFVINRAQELLNWKNDNKNLLQWAQENNLQTTFTTLVRHKPTLLLEALNNGADHDRFSCIYEDLGIVKSLLKLGKEARETLFLRPSTFNLTPLHFAALAGNIETMKLIGKEFVRLYKIASTNHFSILHCAINSKKLNAVEYLLNLPKLPDFIQLGMSLLSFTVTNGTPEMIRILLAYLDPLRLNDKFKNDTRTLLHMAVSTGKILMFETVLDHAPTLLSVMISNFSFLHSAAALPKSDEMVTYLISRFPKESTMWWQKNHNGQTPDELFRARNNPRSPSVILRELLKNALMIVLLNYQDQMQEALELIDAYKNKLLMLISETEMLTQSEISSLLESPNLPNLLGAASAKQLRHALSLKMIQHTLISQHLCKQHLMNIVQIAQSNVNLSSTKFFASKSMLCSELQRLIVNISRQPEERLTLDEVVTLSVILHDYQVHGMNDSTRLTDSLILKALDASQSMQELKPKAQKAIIRDIKPENFLIHLHSCSLLIPTLKEDIKNKVTTIFSGIEHIINNRERIIQFVTANHGQLYELGEKLPLHTDHVSEGKVEEYYATLQRLVTDFLGAFFIASDAGHIGEFCDKMTQGYCLEGKLREALTWASGLSEIQTFDELMKKYIKEYLAYQKVMHQQSFDDASNATAATNFILQRHKDFYCKPDPIYAPEGSVTQFGVRKYVIKVLMYDNEPIVKRPRHIESSAGV